MCEFELPMHLCAPMTTKHRVMIDRRVDWPVPLLDAQTHSSQMASQTLLGSVVRSSNPRSLSEINSNLSHFLWQKTTLWSMLQMAG